MPHHSLRHRSKETAAARQNSRWCVTTAYASSLLLPETPRQQRLRRHCRRMLVMNVTPGRVRKWAQKHDAIQGYDKVIRTRVLTSTQAQEIGVEEGKLLEKKHQKLL